jgi:hypothetical protein
VQREKPEPTRLRSIRAARHLAADAASSLRTANLPAHLRQEDPAAREDVALERLGLEALPLERPTIFESNRTSIGARRTARKDRADQGRHQDETLSH